MRPFNCTWLLLLGGVLLLSGLRAQENSFGKVVVTETAGLERQMEYIEISLQISPTFLANIPHYSRNLGNGGFCNR